MNTLQQQPDKFISDLAYTLAALIGKQQPFLRQLHDKFMEISRRYMDPED